METIAQIFTYAVFGNFVSHWFGPIQWLKEKMGLYRCMPEWTWTVSWIDCSKCMSFWIALFMTHDVAIAAFSAVTGYVLKWVLDLIEAWYEH